MGAAADYALQQEWFPGLHPPPLPPRPQNKPLLQPALDDTATELVPKYRLTLLPPADWPALAAAAAAAAAAEASGGGSHAEAIAAARAFDLVEAAASGLPLPHSDAAAGPADPRAAAAPATTAGGGSNSSEGGGAYGPGRPYWAQLSVNRRLTAPDHFQDVRHLELELGPGAPAYEAGDVLALMPAQPAAAVDALLQVGGSAWVGGRWSRQAACARSWWLL